MGRVCFLFFLFLVLSSVQKAPPLDLLARDQMVAVLVDLELARAAVGCYTSDETQCSYFLKRNVQLICESHGISVDVLQRSFQYYLVRLGTLKGIYGEVASYFEKLRAG